MRARRCRSQKIYLLALLCPAKAKIQYLSNGSLIRQAGLDLEEIGGFGAHHFPQTEEGLEAMSALISAYTGFAFRVALPCFRGVRR